MFYDTPGLVTQREIKKHNLGQSFKSAYRHAIQNTDMIAVVHDVSNVWTRKTLHPTVMDSLKAYPQKPSVLILNKIDALKSKRITLELIRILTNDTLSSGKKRTKNSAKKPQLEELDNEPKESKEEPAAVEFGNLHENVGSWSNFSDVFLISAITGNGLNEVNVSIRHRQIMSGDISKF